MDAVKHHAITTVCHEETYNVFGNFQTTDHTLSSSHKSLLIYIFLLHIQGRHHFLDEYI